MIRIAITQPDIRPYRLPVYNLLAVQDDIELSLFADLPPDAPAPEPGSMNFEFHYSKITRGGRGPFSYYSQPAQLEVMDPDRFDMVIMPWNARYRTLAPALKRARKVGMPTVVWGHGYSKSDNWLRTTLRNRVGRKASAVMLYTHPIAEELIASHGFDAQRVFVAQNAIDQTPIIQGREDWLARPADLAAFQSKNRLEPAKTIAFVSRLLAENQPELLIEAAKPLADQHNDLRLVMIGDGPERGALEDLTMQLGIAERVTFTGAIYSEAELAPWLLSSSVFCYPVNIGLSLLTAFGFGLPVVTADNIAAQNPEIAALQHNKNGLLYEHGNHRAMIDAINSLLSERELQTKLSREALRTVNEDFTLPNMVQGFLDTTRLVDGKQRTVRAGS